MINERNKITISFLPVDKDLWNFIQEKKKNLNISEYIRSLIRKDMNGSNEVSINEEVIVSKVLEGLKNSKALNLVNNENITTVEEELIKDETKDTIKSLF